MTREQKLALILGFALVLVVGVLLSDHLSKAGRVDALTTEGLDDRFALEQPRNVNPLLVNPQGVNARPEPPIETREQDEPSFFDGLAEQFKRGINEVRDLPEAVQTTDTRRDGVPEFQMGDEPGQGRGREAPARVHHVLRNETLWGIAKEAYGDGALHKQLALYNHDRIGPGGALREGASILIPSKGTLLAYRPGDERIVERSGAPKPQRRQEQTARSRTYVVKKNETLSEIAKERLGSARRWREIVELNAGTIPENGSVREGQEILLPAD